MQQKIISLVSAILCFVVLSCDNPTEHKTLVIESGKKIRYWSNYDLAKSNPGVDRAVIVVHGSSRNAYDYGLYVYNAAKKEGVENSTIIIAPNFITIDESPNINELYWTSWGWKVGDSSVNIPNSSSFTVIDVILEKLFDSGNYPILTDIVITGHSAGGQFTNRYAAGSQSASASIDIKYIVVNPSSYLYFDQARRVPGTLDDFYFPGSGDIDCYLTYNNYKYGLNFRNSYMDQLSESNLRNQYFSRDVVYFLGENDNDPDHSSLDKNCPAMLQGDHRFERGIIYYNYISGYWSCPNHDIVTVPGVAHSGNKMYNSSQGRGLLFQ